MTDWPVPICALLLLLVAASSRAELFASDAVLEVELRGPISATLRDKRKRAERSFTIVLNGESWPVEVRVRGKSRAEECRFPPLRLNFGKHDVSDGPFAGLGKVKLVTHCRGTEHYHANVLEEYAAYRMFSLLSDVGHRVRLMQIRYIDTSKPRSEPLVRYAFALEPIEHVAERTAGEVLHVPHVVKSRVALEQASLVFAFHYMIANTDWSLVTAKGEKSCCHNGSLVQRDGMNYLVPYDFDLAGFVNPRYSATDRALAIRRVTTRLYRGYCIDGLDPGAAIDTMIAREADLLAIVRYLPDAADKVTDERLDFLARFFELARAGGLASHFESNCVG